MSMFVLLFTVTFISPTGTTVVDHVSAPMTQTECQSTQERLKSVELSGESQFFGDVQSYAIHCEPVSRQVTSL